jgi:hypothetical protein
VSVCLPGVSPERLPLGEDSERSVGVVPTESGRATLCRAASGRLDLASDRSASVTVWRYDLAQVRLFRQVASLSGALGPFFITEAMPFSIAPLDE